MIPARNERSNSDMPSGVFGGWLGEMEWTEMCACAALPALVGVVLGANVARRPYAAAML